MTFKSLGNPFDADTRLTHSRGCDCDLCTAEARASQGLSDRERQILMERQADREHSHPYVASLAIMTPAGAISSNW